MATPSLGVNLGVDPFARGRRSEQLPVMERDDGFAEDGSYAVIRDRPKLEAMAMAEYDARRKNPRYIGGRIMEEDTPAALQRELLEPLRILFSRSGTLPQPQPRTYEIGNSLVQRDPITGEFNVAYQGPGKPDADFGRQDQIKYQALLRDRTELLSKRILNSSQRSLLNDINEQIKQLEGTQAAPATSAAAPQPFIDFRFSPNDPRGQLPTPQAGNFIGTPGGTNQFSSVSNPFIPTNSQRRLKFNQATGKLE